MTMGIWSLDLSQMVLASRNQLKPFNIILLYNFDFYNFAEKPNLGIPQAVPDHALLLEV